MRKLLTAFAVAAVGIALTLPAAEAQRGSRGGSPGGGFSGGGMRGGFSGGSPGGGFRGGMTGGGFRGGMAGSPGGSFGSPSFAPRGMRPMGPSGIASPRASRPGWTGGRPGGWHHHHHGHRHGWRRPYYGGWYGGFYPGYYTGYSTYYDDPYYYDDYAPSYRYRTAAPRYYGGLAPRGCRLVKVKRKGKWVKVRRCR